MNQPPEPVHDSTQTLPTIGEGAPKASFSLPSSEVSEPLSGGRPPEVPPQDAVPIVGQSYTVEPSPLVNPPPPTQPAPNFPISGPAMPFPASGPSSHGHNFGSPGTTGFAPPVGPPNFPPQQRYYPGPPPSGGNGKIIAIAVAAVVVLVGGGIGLMAVLSSGDDDPGDGGFNEYGIPGEPADVVEPMIVALEKGDEQAYTELLCSKNKKELKPEMAALSGGGEFDLKIDAGEPKTEKINDEEYTVIVDAAVEIEYNGDTIKNDYLVTLDVIAEADEWKICGFEDDIQ